ncbi:unnamed protein product [Ectocarpus sp. 12 AP-2014]
MSDMCVLHKVLCFFAWCYNVKTKATSDSAFFARIEDRCLLCGGSYSVDDSCKSYLGIWATQEDRCTQPLLLHLLPLCSDLRRPLPALTVSRDNGWRAGVSSVAPSRSRLARSPILNPPFNSPSS